LENSAIGLGTSADFESLGITLSCLSHLKSQGLDIFVDVLLNPAFDKKQLAIAREGAIEGVRRKNDNINQIARRAFRDAVYGSKHPYAHEPSEKTLAGVKQQHLIDIHKKLVNPVGSVLTVTGDFNKDEMVKELETRFSSWKQNVMDSCSYDYSPAPDQKGKIIYVEKDFTQSRITIGRAGFARRDPDEYALKIADYILGGGGPSRLFNEVRSRLGLAYVVGSFVLPYQGPGPVGVGCQTKAGSTLAAIKAIKKIMAEMVSSAPSNEEVQLAKDSLINSYVFNFATASQIAGAYATSEFYGYSNDYVGTYIPRLAALTPMDIFAAAKKHYQWWSRRHRILRQWPCRQIRRRLVSAEFQR
jgi:predicted Zn-dependent peptidase